MSEVPSNHLAELAVRERQELTRLCAARVMRNHGNGVPIDPETLRWARWITAHIKPLGRPLSSGDYTKQENTQ